MFIGFENFIKENVLFSKLIKSRIESVFVLKSEYEHQKYIQNFEKEFSEYNGSQYVIAVNSGTTALELALSALGIQAGDEVVLPSYTYISTALAVSNLGATPSFVDIKYDTLTIDPEKIIEKITSKTKAIISVHIHGNPCEMDKIMEISRQNNLAVIEDCSHAHGAEYRDKKVGNFGIGCFSCHTTKVLSGIGNSGLITINDEGLYQRIKEMMCVKNEPVLHLSRRTPCTMDALQASVLTAKLSFLDKILHRKRLIVDKYLSVLPQNLGSQKVEDQTQHAYRDFVVLSENRNQLQSTFENVGIQVKARYGVPLHRVQYYKDLGYQKEDLPVTECIAQQALCLPISYALSDAEVQYICDTIKRTVL